VLSLTGEKPLPETTGAHLAEILVSGGVNASATVARFTSSSIGLSIQQAALELGADILVMGGFGHSRLRDFVLGGATDGVLHEPLLPVLMSH
jgi:nucleotide-binding universal stress UspA family protein